MKPSGHERESDTEADVRLAAPGELGRPSGVGGRLLERGDELQRFVSAIALAKVDNGQVVTLEGSAGIGKTRLLRAAMELAAASGVVVVSARGGQMESEFAFGVVRQLFEPVLAAAETGEREALLDGSAAPAAWVVGVTSPAGEDETPGGDRGFATLHGLYWLTANLAGHAPLLMAVDDAHWADAPSLRF